MQAEVEGDLSDILESPELTLVASGIEGGEGPIWFDPTGKLRGKILTPDRYTRNCAFGGNDLKTLYITTYTAVYGIRVRTPGIGVAYAKTIR